ncbi:SDR family NAD(P)-dependent oxidoreductase [Photobacterium sp. WH77]|uniref:SDR family NAD(P)-dependent oxidoreductase n=1 Tax=unclassified Photobacterium TaxID=2628852 RepID=UPI001EDC8271|nr:MULTISPECIES: SDR family NAD(P)-dependent oxidoreductase [unclassified Photobacterium]MCG2838139.1 SDR family NAD(P)-dependent oxidoreductase [Photobacterium sp. WH77]MCG2845757.1 SDR family NAD(P)-dependent oxidoreductase [Photobacterium sp. WH80]
MITHTLNQTFADKIVLVTGASTGLGAQAADYLANKGFIVFAGVRDTAKVSPSPYTNMHYVELDVTCAESIECAVSQISSVQGARLWAVVNNAGICVPSPLEMLPVDNLRNQLETNVVGQLLVTQKVLPLLRKTQGRVINITSGLGNLALPYLGAYSIAQFAKEAFSDALRRELHHSGIDVIVVQPGAINTPIWDKFQAVGEDIVQQAPKQLKLIYSRSFHEFLAASPVHAQQSPTTAEDFAHVICKALTDEHPHTRYAVGEDATNFRIKARSQEDRELDEELSAAMPRHQEFHDELMN